MYIYIYTYMLGSVIQIDTNITDLLAKHCFINLYPTSPLNSHRCVCWCLKRPEECVPLELELEAAVSHLTGTLNEQSAVNH